MQSNHSFDLLVYSFRFNPINLDLYICRALWERGIYSNHDNYHYLRCTLYSVHRNTYINPWWPHKQNIYRWIFYKHHQFSIESSMHTPRIANTMWHAQFQLDNQMRHGLFIVYVYEGQMEIQMRYDIVWSNCMLHCIHIKTVYLHGIRFEKKNTKKIRNVSKSRLNHTFQRNRIEGNSQAQEERVNCNK